MTAISTDSTVGQLVVQRPSRSRVFQRLGIDFCCGGKKRLLDACRDKGLDTDEVVQALAADEAISGQGGVDVAGMGLSQLCDHIEQTHHAYLHTELPRVGAMAKKVAAVHGANHPWTVELASVFAGFSAELDTHMVKEERVLFPWIRTLEKSGRCDEGHCSGSIANPIRMMEHEHDNAGRAMERMRELSHGYTPPPGACNTFIAMLDGLARIESDMHQHVHKENNILFPKAALREESTA
ncbi:MAG: iron-sulfur cluster repair di-iron protein [Planctomycetes bacterium]|nr:iron-sulfur cluster repair di-iron protein [Planctomycetota bacterium]